MFKKSFYDWCKENGFDSFLQRWDYDMNKEKPEDVSCSDIKKKYFFLCENGLHKSESHLLSDIKYCKKVPGCSVCQSFGIWCEKNNRFDFLKRWDYELNKISPYEISTSSKKKCYFKCPRGIHESELKDLNNMRKQYKSGICKQCDSVGQFLIDNYGCEAIEKFWSTKNICSAFDISKRSNSKIWIKCQSKDYHPDYEVTSANFLAGRRCPHCAGKKVCKEDSLAGIYPEALKVWSEKNKFSPYDFMPMSNKQAIWCCENGIHKDYSRTISDAQKRGFCCPQCVKLRTESILQEKVRLYLETLFDDVRHEYQCRIKAKNPKTNYPLPYDNEVVDIDLIIEVHGIQHYKANSFSYFKNHYNDNQSMEKAFKYRQYLDKIKKEYAISHGYHFLEIPYWTDDKKETYKKLIDNKIAKIKNIE